MDSLIEYAIRDLINSLERLMDEILENNYNEKRVNYLAQRVEDETMNYKKMLTDYKKEAAGSGKPSDFANENPFTKSIPQEDLK
jgi:hypothetical protein